MNEQGESWVDEYRPESLDDVQGNNKALKQIKKWYQNFTPGDKPWLLWGDQGTGKTSTAEALANDAGWPMEEINASSARSTDDVARFASQIRNGAIGGGYKLVLIDEADSFHSSSSLRPLSEVLDNAPNPVIVTANEKYQVPDSITNKCRVKKFKVNKGSKKAVINRINEAEELGLSKKEVGKLATRDDLRSAINDLQRFSQSNSMVGWDERETDIGEFEAVDNILRGKSYTGDVSPRDLVMWLDENVPSELEGVELMRAYQALSESDKWLQVTNETQDYSWWRYAGSIGEEVASMRITEPYDWINKSFPVHFRQSRPNPDGESPEAKLYRSLKDSDIPGYSASFNYSEFRNIILPLLTDLQEEERMQICLSKSVPSSALSALNLTESEYEDWLMEEKEDDGTTELSDFSQDEEEEEKTSLFDF